MWSITQLLAIQMLQWLSESGGVSPGHGPFQPAWIGLYQAGTPAVQWASLMSSIVEANYDGYARQQVVWYPVYQSTGGPAALEGGSLFFQPADAAVPNTITGIFLASAATGGNLWAGQAFTGPGLVLSGPLSICKVIPEITLGPAQVYGGATIMS